MYNPYRLSAWFQVAKLALEEIQDQLEEARPREARSARRMLTALALLRDEYRIDEL